jgi:hypothetical protein
MPDKLWGKQKVFSDPNKNETSHPNICGNQIDHFRRTKSGFLNCYELLQGNNHIKELIKTEKK